jgi:hypothetical protein
MPCQALYIDIQVIEFSLLVYVAVHNLVALVICKFIVV